MKPIPNISYKTIKKLVEKHKDPTFGTYDYDSIAVEVIKLVTMRNKPATDTDREEFEKLKKELSGITIERWKDWQLNVLWSWIQSYKQKALLDQLKRVREVVGKDEKIPRQGEVRTDMFDRLARNQLRAELRQKLDKMMEEIK